MYRSDQRILLVGDGDLSFTLALARAFGSGDNLTTTTLDDLDFLRTHYANVEETIDSLRACGAQVHYGVDATRLDVYSGVLGNAPLPDIIVFNFPHPGWPKDRRTRHENQAVMIERHRTLLRGFFESTRRVARRTKCPALEVHAFNFIYTLQASCRRSPRRVLSLSMHAPASAAVAIVAVRPSVTGSRVNPLSSVRRARPTGPPQSSAKSRSESLAGATGEPGSAEAAPLAPMPPPPPPRWSGLRGETRLPANS
jgi:25S rRNA (uracil2634-N3)-methyltransferase